jgi:DNA-damage-inducible protein D
MPRQHHSQQDQDPATSGGDLAVFENEGGEDFALFQDWGYRGLYNGETARDIAARKGLPRGQAILDHMGPEELGDNLFRIVQTEAKLRRDAAEGISGKGHANATHHAVGREVREAIQRLGGTMPEDLPTPAESIKQLQRLEQQRIEAAAITFF